jgi:cytochrome c-type biogenesis protein CcmH
VAARADDLDTQARAIAAELRCPVCQNLSAADSPSELAAQMRSVIRTKLAAGETRQAILDYFVERYGEEVLLDAPARGFNLLLYAGPLALGGLAAAVAGTSLARWRRVGLARRGTRPRVGGVLRP